MLTIWELIASMILGLPLGLMIVYATKNRMKYYKDEYTAFWTTTKFIVLFIVTTVISGILIALSMFY
jgi:hypothetical protein